MRLAFVTHCIQLGSWESGHRDNEKKFVWAVCNKPQGIGCRYLVGTLAGGCRCAVA